jgi:DNA primase
MRPVDLSQGKPPKYINSGETALFQKGHILYNESHARTAAARASPVIVCEG